MSRTYRNITHANHNARHIRIMRQHAAQEALIDEMKDEGYASYLRQRDLRQLPHHNDDTTPSATVEYGWVWGVTRASAETLEAELGRDLYPHEWGTLCDTYTNHYANPAASNKRIHDILEGIFLG